MAEGVKGQTCWFLWPSMWQKVNPTECYQSASCPSSLFLYEDKVLLCKASLRPLASLFTVFRIDFFLFHICEQLSEKGCISDRFLDRFILINAMSTCGGKRLFLLTTLRAQFTMEGSQGRSSNQKPDLPLSTQADLSLCFLYRTLVTEENGTAAWSIFFV